MTEFTIEFFFVTLLSTTPSTSTFSTTVTWSTFSSFFSRRNRTSSSSSTSSRSFTIGPSAITSRHIYTSFFLLFLKNCPGDITFYRRDDLSIIVLLAHFVFPSTSYYTLPFFSPCPELFSEEY